MEKEFAINISTKTWTRDSHGLYDYESQQVKPQEGTLLNKAIVIRKRMDIKFVKSIHDKKEDEELLCEIKIENDRKNFKLIFSNYSHLKNFSIKLYNLNYI